MIVVNVDDEIYYLFIYGSSKVKGVALIMNKMKRLLVVACMTVVAATLFGCGPVKKEEPEVPTNYIKKADETVDEYNENVEKIDETSNSIDESVEE